MILACTIVLWALLSFPQLPRRPAAGAAEVAADRASSGARSLRHSYAGRLGHAIEPAIAPLGFDWKIGVGIIGAFAAREVFVSTMGVVYGVGNGRRRAEPHAAPGDARRAPLRRPAPLHAARGPVPDGLLRAGLPVHEHAGVVRRETGSWRWPAFLFAYMTALAWVASFVVYQGGRLLGFQ